jgi:adenylate cyclase
MTKDRIVLIVDDEPFNRDLLIQELSEMGLASVCATNGQEALEIACRTPPDLILLDIIMPVMDGFETCRILKGSEQTRLIPVIIMTALNATDDRIKGIEAGADDFLTKPVDNRELRARIVTTLRHKEAIDGRISRAEQVSEQYSKFVPEVVKKLVESNPEAPDLEKRDRDVAVLFADITGYVQLSEKLTSDALTKLVEIYFGAYIDHIHAGSGDVCSTAGDGLMAIFHEGSPEELAVRASETALALMGATHDINRRLGEEPVELHIGLNAGMASFGATRYEGLKGKRWVFTADGMVVNLASRIADCAERGEVLLGPAIADRLKGRFKCESVGKRSMKNYDQSIELFRLAAEVR